MNIRYQALSSIVGLLTALFFFNSMKAIAQEPDATQAEKDTVAWKRYPIEVYCNKTSVTQGQSINVYVAAGDSVLAVTSPRFKIQVFRIGVTNELYQTIDDTSFNLHFQHLHGITGNVLPAIHYSGEAKPYDFRAGCSWPLTRTLSIPSNWKSGLYFVKCSLVSDSTISRRAPFVVSQAIPGSTSNILYKIPFNTYQAYNGWGGGDLYGSDSNLVQGNDTVSFLRPMGGLSCHLERTDIGSFDLTERYFIQWAEGAGYVMEYCTNVDLDADANNSLINSYKMIVTSGHDEYWTSLERDDIESKFIGNQTATGGNAAFLSGNICYWKAAYLNSQTRMAVGKHTSTGATTNDSLWRNVSQKTKSEAKFIGVQYHLLGNLNWHYSGKTDNIKLPSHWLFKGISPQFSIDDTLGSGFIDPLNAAGVGIVGGEVDKEDTSSPSNVEIISSYTFSNGVHHDASFYADTHSNARVFGAGSIYWSRGFKGSDSAKFKIVMTNLMDHFSEKKFVGNIYGSSNRWIKNIEIDGNVNIVAGAALKLDNMTLTIDAGDTLFVDGTLQFNEPVNVAGSGIIKINSGGKLNIQTTILGGWNMVSVPNIVGSFLKASVYPGTTPAVSAAFAYEGGYVTKDTLKNGPGYWLKYASGQPLTYIGNTGSKKLDTLVIPVVVGWNLIGSISSPLAISKIVKSDTAMHLSKYYKYTGTYSAIDTIQPGLGYWIKSDKDGTLTLNINSTANNAPSTSTVLPPNPPPPDAPVLSGTASGSHPQLSWTSTGTTYKLYRYKCPNDGSGDCFEEAGKTLIYQGSATSYIDNGVIIGNKFSNTVDYYYVNALDTYNQSSPNSNAVTFFENNVTRAAHINEDGEESTPAAIPTITALKGNYPNPFNPITVIRYDLSEDARVSLKIYNVYGQEVKTLVNGVEGAGYKSVSFDASILPSGLYFYRLQAGKFSDVKKMLLLK